MPLITTANSPATLPPEAGQVRWQIPLALMVTLFIGFLDRMNISLALPLIARDFNWTQEELRTNGGDLLTLFYVGYGLANLFLSPLGAKFGPRRSLIVIVVLWSFFTAMGAIASSSFMALLASRIALGLSEGIHFPMMNMLCKHWFPPHERARANGIWMAGLLLAICLSPVLLIPLMHHLGWYMGFIIIAAGGLLISLPVVWWFVWDDPSQHPRLSIAERNYILAANANEHSGVAPGPGALRRAIARPIVWIMLLTSTLHNVVGLGLSLWLPTYFVTNKGLPYEDLIYATSLPYIFGVAGLGFWAVIGDRLNLRAWIGAFGFLGAAVCIWCALHAASVAGSIAGFTGAVFFISAFPACEFALVQRVLPKEVIGQGVGLYNGLAAMIGGGAGPIVISSIIGGVSADGNPAGILATVGTCLVAAVMLLAIGKVLKY